MVNWCTFCKFYNTGKKECMKHLIPVEQARQVKCVNASGFERTNQIGKRYYTLKYTNPYFNKWK